MTEQQFENLKVGDKVWIFLDKPKKTFVIAKQKDIGSGFLSVQVDNGGFHPTYVAEYVFLTKSEAWEHQIKIKEELVGRLENQKAGEERLLDQYKTELAKAEEEEEEEKAKKIKPYYVTYLTGKVEKYPFVIDGYEYTTHFTEQEAYEALAEYYKRKLFKTLEKCGYKFAICCDKNIAVVKIDKDRGDIWWCYYYPHLSYGSVRKTNVFDTLDEAEAQLKREKDGD